MIADGASMACGRLRALRLECFVEIDPALGDMPIEGQSEKDLRGDTLQNKCWRVLESELPVVMRMPHNTATGSIQLLQPGKPLLNQSGTNALPLVLRQDRNRSKPVPIECAVGNGDGRERYVPNDSTVSLGDKRHGKRAVGSQCLDDELLGLIANFQRFECRDCDRGDLSDIGVRLVFDYDVCLHNVRFLLR
jgi:hypothetical protein